jgi:hypothetical protein
VTLLTLALPATDQEKSLDRNRFRPGKMDFLMPDDNALSPQALAAKGREALRR